MRCREIMTVVLCATWALFARNTTKLETQIGIFPLKTAYGDSKEAAEVLSLLKAELKKVGGYDIRTADAMKKAFQEIHRRFPERCDNPDCAAAVGSALQLERMLYGGVDRNGKKHAVRLTMVDVLTHQIIEKISLEEKASIGLEKLMEIAVGKLHGREDAGFRNAVQEYYGREVHNKRQMMISAATCLAAGFIWGAANGSLTGRDEDERVAETIEAGDLPLSGIATGEDQIPLFGRPGALANTYVAESNDSYGVFFNPAGLPWSRGGEVSFGYQYRFGLNNFAASYVNKATRDLGFGQGFLYSGDSLANTTYFFSALGYRFNALTSWIPPLAIGATVKLRSFKLAAANSPDATTGNSFGYGLNLGLQMDVSEQIRGGILLKNVPMININRNTYSNIQYSETDAPLLQVGGTFKANHATFLICESRIPLIDDQPWKFAGAMERLMFRIIRARIGIAREVDYDKPWQFTGGFGLDLEMGDGLAKYLKVDGSYEYNTIQVFAHVANVSLRFGF
ncbi:MAG: hypothetical protein GF344_03030 [Chitinivibrionales bacterium]|nr:hypothetical protein [Chitinivibrionales bacterium]MBD3356053.1 hypothetical protein [Chitinivibrionales bacterium]